MSRDTRHASDRRHGRVTSTHITISEEVGVLFSSKEWRDSGVRDPEPLTRFPPIHSEPWHHGPFSPLPGTPGRGEPVLCAKNQIILQMCTRLRGVRGWNPDAYELDRAPLREPLPSIRVALREQDARVRGR